MKPFSLNRRTRELLGLVFQHRFRLGGAMAFSLLIAATTSAIPFLLKPVLDDIFINQDTSMLKMLPLAVILLYLMRGIGLYGQEYMMNYVGESIIRRLRDRLYDHIQDMPLAFFHRERTGVLMSRITNDVNVVKAMVSTAVTGTLRDAFTIMGLTFVIFYRDWKMALFAFFILPLACYPVVEVGRRVRRVSTGCQEAMADMSSFLHETLAGNKIVKAFGRETYEKERFFEKTRRLFQLELRAVVARSLSSPVMEVLAGIGIAFIIWYGGSRVIEGTHTAGTFVSFLGAVILLYDPVKKLTHLNNAIQQGMAAVERIYDVLEAESNIVEADSPLTLPEGSHRVVFHEVFFSYDGDEMVLKDIRLDVQPGEVLALVGMSGGGKTSLVNLIPRFYDVHSGAVRIDGFDVRDLSIGSLREQIAIVTQEPILFNDTVRNNIAYGKPDATDEEIRQAAIAAYAHDFITGFPKGYETGIGELGSRLSGGEKQRICIARALLKDAPILILDEATSSLDTESEMLVQRALENLMEGRTTFVIAHRLSTIAYADRIVVLVNGRIVEQGQHQQLLAAGKEYFKLHQLQVKEGP
jgi:subfamily B ATP-binding cassette protein MsbA